MRIEWHGKPELAESSSPGTLCFFIHRNQTHLGIRADDDRRGIRIKGLVSFSTGYLEPPRCPAFFDLSSILVSSRIVYSIPNAALALPTERNRIHPGRNSAELMPGLLALLGDSLFLCVACNGNLPFLNLADGMLMKEWPASDQTVWFSAWSIVWRENYCLKTLLDFDASQASVV